MQAINSQRSDLLEPMSTYYFLIDLHYCADQLRNTSSPKNKNKKTISISITNSRNYKRTHRLRA